MSLAEQSARPNGRAKPSAGVRPKRETFERMSRSPGATFPTPSGRPLRVHVDRVRARPAVSPSLAMNIGVTAVGLGLWGLLFPRHVKRTLGVRSPVPVVRTLFGVRELITGFTLAGDPTKSGMLWARFAGDIFDIMALKGLDSPSNPKRGAARAALGFVLVVTALDFVTAVRMTDVRRNCDQGGAR